MSLGIEDGSTGALDGAEEGSELGLLDGAEEGSELGPFDGIDVGMELGLLLGSDVSLLMYARRLGEPVPWLVTTPNAAEVVIIVVTSAGVRLGLLPRRIAAIPAT